MKKTNSAKTNTIVFFSICTFFIILFTIKGMVVIDPDFGWHLQTGKIIIATGKVPATDPFSYTMSNYPFIDHSWLMSVGTALFYPHIGLGGLSLLFALVGVGAYALQYATTKKTTTLPLFISLFSCLSFIGIRSQVNTLLFFSILLSLLKQGKKIQLLIIPLMAMWVNLHGGFFMGIITLIIFTATESIQLKKISFFHLILSAACLLVSFCNPYGVQIWREVLLTATDLVVRASIREWMPATFYIHIPFWIYTGFIIALVLRYKNVKKNLFNLVLGGFILINAFLGMRHIPLWLLTTFSLWGQYVPLLEKDVARNKTTQTRFNKVKKTALYVMSAACIIQSIFFIQSISSSTENAMYPTKALTYLKSQKQEGNLFTLYGWGGYMVWKYPQKKTFTDGRMPVWKWNNKDARFLSYAYGNYLKIFGGEESFGYYRRKYNITHVLVPTKKNKDQNDPFSIYPIEYSDETATLYNTK